mgnify:CR=1 FL=1
MHDMVIQPINYELVFEPLFHNFKFNGEEIITLNLSKSTNSIILDAAELTVKKCDMEHKGKVIPVKSSLNEKNDITIEIRDDFGIIDTGGVPKHVNGTVKTNTLKLILGWNLGI